jgi:hypothetical protein
MFPAFLMPNTTDASQHVDHNNGKEIKRDLARLFQGYLEKFDWGKNPAGKISLRTRRMTMAKFVNQVVEEWETRHPNLVQSTAISCGMAMAIDGTNSHLIHPPLYAFQISTFSIFLKLFPGILQTSPRLLSLAMLSTTTLPLMSLSSTLHPLVKE